MFNSLDALNLPATKQNTITLLLYIHYSSTKFCVNTKLHMLTFKYQWINTVKWNILYRCFYDDILKIIEKDYTKKYCFH